MMSVLPTSAFTTNTGVTYVSMYLQSIDNNVGGVTVVSVLVVNAIEVKPSFEITKMLKLQRFQAHANFYTEYFVLFSTFTLSGLEFYLGANKTQNILILVRQKQIFFNPVTVSTKIISAECRQVCQNQIFINF